MEKHPAPFGARDWEKSVIRYRFFDNGVGLNPQKFTKLRERPSHPVYRSVDGPRGVAIGNLSADVDHLLFTKTVPLP